MPELRTDWLLGRSVLVAENRAERPNEFQERPTCCQTAELGVVGTKMVPSMVDANPTGPFACPFCRGAEHRTPPALLELTDEHGQWQTRVVPNMYPAVELRTTDGAPTHLPPADYSTGPGASAVPAIGVHEVIIESPRHVDRMSALTEHELREVLTTYTRRLRHWRDDGRFAYGLVFKNQGARAGASLAHLHSQLIALPDLPTTVEAEFDRATGELRRCGTCPYCRLVELERAAGERIVLDASGFFAFCPFASLQPFEVWLVPARHEPCFEDSDPDSLVRLASVLCQVLWRVESVVPESAYNMLLRTAPWGSGEKDGCHWRIEILPRTTAIAGLELASGVFINPIAPERAASKLRSI